MRSWLPAVLLALAGPLGACGDGPLPRSPSRPSLLEPPGASAPPYRTPAVWRYHPKHPGTLFAKAPLPDGRLILAGQRGERWRVDPRTRQVEVAADVAPEDLLSVAPREKGGWLFVGRSGTAYEAEEPLGPFVRSSAPLEPLVRVRTAGGALVGIRRDGGLVGSEGIGAAWRPIGAPGERFEDALIRPDGKGLALGVPEALWETRDSGKTFTRLAVPTFGAEELYLDEAEGIVVLGALGARRWQPDGTPPFVTLPSSFTTRAFTLGGSPPLGPSASALAEGSAFVSGPRWMEVRSADVAGRWQLVRGTFGAPLEAVPLEAAKGCLFVAVAGFGDTAYLACARQKDRATTQVLEVLRSTDSGGTWLTEPYVVHGKMSELLLAVGAGGELLASGLCPAAQSGAGCRPAGVHRRREVPGDSGMKIAFEPAATPSLAGVALALSFSLDGRTAFAVGRRSKNDALAVFVSRAGESAFEARDVEALALPEEDGSRGGTEVTIESSGAAEDGTIAFVVNRQGRRAWLVVDDEGRPAALARPPVETASIGAAGERALAVDLPSREAWESLDAGASWAPLGKLPLDPCPAQGKCTPPVVCVAGGCVIGEMVSRVGWREPPRRVLLSAPAADGARRAEPRVGVPLTCSLDPGEWRRLPGARRVPDAADAAIGKALWFALTEDADRAAVSIFHARPGGSLALEETRLLDPAKRPEEFAYIAQPQIEGAAALRFRLPGVGGSRDPALSDVEVAWVDLLAGRSGRAVIADAGGYRPGDYENTRGLAKAASPAILTISAGGVYARLHRALGDDQPTFFLDGRVQEIVPPVPWPPQVARRGRSEMVHAGGVHVPVRIDGPVAARARRSGGGFVFDAAKLGWAEPKGMGVEQDVDLAYSGLRAGLRIVVRDSAGRESRALLYTFRAEGAVFDDPVPMPTQFDLPKSPRACSAADRSSSPRAVVPFHPGTRRPVFVVDPTEPLRVLLTQAAVLHGTPVEPCVAAYDAPLVSMEGASPAQGLVEGALVSIDPKERSWLFRLAAAPPRAAGADRPEPRPVLEYRPMACRQDPGAEIPIEVFRESGTLVGASAR